MTAFDESLAAARAQPDDTREAYGLDVWACMTIYAHADTEKQAHAAIKERYAGTLDNLNSLDMFDGTDIPLDGEDFISSAITLYGPHDGALLVAPESALLEAIRAACVPLKAIIEEAEGWHRDMGEDVNDEAWKDGHADALDRAADKARKALETLTAILPE